MDALIGLSPARRRWFVPASIALVAVLVYANALGNGFTLDDKSVIIANDLIHSLSGVWRAFAHPYWPEVWDRGQYRPLVIASFAVQWLIGGGAALPFHLVSIGWHVAACLLLWRVLRTVLPDGGAWIGAVWFAIHPVHVEAVASAAGQSELMAATFVFAAWLAHRRAAPSAPLWFALALLSKESGIVFLALALGDDLLLAPEHGRVALRQRRPLYLVYGVIAAAYLGVLTTVFATHAFSVDAPTWYHASVAARWLTMLRVVPELLRLLVAPVTLNTDYVPRVIDLETTLSPAVAGGAALLAAIVALAIAARRRAPPLAYGVWWFAAAIAPVSNVLFASGVVLAERTVYLPSAGCAVIVGWLCVRAWRAWPRVAVPIAVAGGLLLAGRTWTRTPDWHDDVALIKSALRDTPLSYQAHHSAGVILAFQGRWPEAAVEYRRARELFPFNGDPYRGGAECAIAVRDYLTAAALLDSARRIHPSQFSPLFRLAQVRWMQGQWRAAEGLAFAAYEMLPDSVQAVDLAAGSAMRLGDSAGAQALLRRGLADHPSSARLRRAYAYVLTRR